VSKASPALCWDCHDDFLKDAPYKHAPAESGECAACHKAHASNFKGLMPKADPQVCFECHEEADVAKVAGHKNKPMTTCLNCHNPHAAKDKRLLRAEIEKALGAPAPAPK
jgi:predicted CXXCH cytochrome family protein